MATELVQVVMQFAVRAILAGVGEDPDRPGLVETPDRVVRMYEEMFRGLHEPAPFVKTFVDEGPGGMVIVKELTVVSMCEHHLLPFMGTAAIGYIPNGKVAGLSKFGRVVDHFAAKPQLQEKLTREVMEYLVSVLQPHGLIVHMECEHTCMSIRGVKKPGHKTQTAAFTGCFDDPATRAEFYSNLGR